MNKAKCVICQHWITLGNEWSINNYTEKTHMASGTYGHSTYELYLQYAINRITLSAPTPGQAHSPCSQGQVEYKWQEE